MTSFLSYSIITDFCWLLFSHLNWGKKKIHLMGGFSLIPGKVMRLSMQQLSGELGGSIAIPDVPDLSA